MENNTIEPLCGFPAEYAPK